MATTRREPRQSWKCQYQIYRNHYSKFAYRFIFFFLFCIHILHIKYTCMNLRYKSNFVKWPISCFWCLQHEYMGYMEKKTTKRKTTIITLSDHNKEEIRNIDFQKQNMEEEFNQKKQGVCQTSLFILIFQFFFLS